MDNHNLIYSEAESAVTDKIEEYIIDIIGKIDFERDTIINPVILKQELIDNINLSDYYFVPIKQTKNNLLVIALEPQSMLGLATYKQYEHLIKAGNKYPILRVVQ